jgi:hypothetical protein
MSIWATREVKPVRTDIGDVAKHERVTVRTRNGRTLEFERIEWSNGYKEVWAYDHTFDRILRLWTN